MITHLEIQLMPAHPPSTHTNNNHDHTHSLPSLCHIITHLEIQLMPAHHPPTHTNINHDHTHSLPSLYRMPSHTAHACASPSFTPTLLYTNPPSHHPPSHQPFFTPPSFTPTKTRLHALFPLPPMQALAQLSQQQVHVPFKK